MLYYKRRIHFTEGKKEEGSAVDDIKPYKCQHCSVSMDTQNELDEHNESKYISLIFSRFDKKYCNQEKYRIVPPYIVFLDHVDTNLSNPKDRS